MADISMCKGVQDCPLCEKCYRQNATPAPHWQTWVMIPPALQMDNGWWECDMYWEQRSMDEGTVDSSP